MRLFLSSPSTYSSHPQHSSSFISPSIIYPEPRRCRWRNIVVASTTSKNDKLIVIMGATGSGKSGLSIDLASRFAPSEIINSDKMQVYKGLNITTNKIPLHERRNIPHHFLGDFVPDDVEFNPEDFRLQAGKAISDIISRNKTPLLVGGSNSFIYSLLVDDYDPELNVFDGFDSDPVSSNLRYNCCFLWVDSSIQVLFDYLNKRVDEMLESGMFEELEEYFNSERKRSDTVSGRVVGLKKAIGVPEFERYFNRYHPASGGEWDGVRWGAYEQAVREIKENTRRLAKRQIGKIMKLRGAGWDIRRLDATTAFRMRMKWGDDEWRGVWEKQVVEPSVKIVKRFLDE